MKRFRLLFWLGGEIHEMSHLGECTGQNALRMESAFSVVQGDSVDELKEVFLQIKKEMILKNNNENQDTKPVG